MGEVDFTLALVFGAALLAFWLDARLASVRPQDPAQTLMHAGISLFGLFAAVGVLYLVNGVPQMLFMVTVLAIFLPALIYSLVAGAWMLRALADLVRQAG